jgi:hypothetical protein
MNHLHRFITAVALVAALAACTSAPSQVSQAATTPLSDLNLVRAEIPSVLAAAQRAPYAVPGDGACGAIGAEVRALDAALGADLDTPVTAVNPSLIERGGDAVGGALRNAAEGVVPFRGWVRKLSGAERYSREVASAIAAGTVRRAFLKGLGQAGRCAPPAAPLPP